VVALALTTGLETKPVFPVEPVLADKLGFGAGTGSAAVPSKTSAIFGGKGTGIRFPKPRPNFRAIFGARSPPSIDMCASLQGRNVALEVNTPQQSSADSITYYRTFRLRIPDLRLPIRPMNFAMLPTDPTILARRDATTYVLKVVPSVIDSDLATVLRNDIEQAMKRRPTETRDVVLEVGSVTAMCSSGFEALLLLYRLCKDGALPLKLRGPKPEYYQLLQRMGFTRLFAIDS